MSIIKNKPYAWVPTLYIAEAIPYAVVMTLSTLIFKNMGMSNTDLALYTSWLYLPWVIKPLWSPIVDALRTKKWWIVCMQTLIAGALAGVAFSLNTDAWVQWSLAFFWVMAFSSATHDIAADGFYILALNSHQQALYVGIRNTFYRVGNILVQGGLVMLFGWLTAGAPSFDGKKLIPSLEEQIASCWSLVLGVLAILFAIFVIWHFMVLGSFENKAKTEGKPFAEVLKGTMVEFVNTVKIFFSKPQIVCALLFMLLFRFPEAQLGKMATPFMLDPIDKGGLALSTEIVGFVYGTVGVIGLTIGGILGGFAVAAHGLKRWLWPMVLSISLPDAVYIYLSYSQCQNLYVINSCVFIEQFGYGFGFTAYMLYLVYFARGENSTSIYALCTGIMALGMMLPGMIAGKLCDTIGYPSFFLWVMGCCLVTVLVSAFIKVDAEYGKKKQS